MKKGIRPTEELLTATGQFFRIESLHTATSSGSAEKPPAKAHYTVMDGDSYSLQKLLLSFTGSH